MYVWKPNAQSEGEQSKQENNQQRKDTEEKTHTHENIQKKSWKENNRVQINVWTDPIKRNLEMRIMWILCTDVRPIAILAHNHTLIAI